MSEPKEPVRPIPIWGDGGRKIIEWARVSVADYDWVKLHRWFLTDGYAYRTVYIDGRKTTMPMHREIMGLANGELMEVDHHDRERLHNERTNLRVATRWQNEQNKPPHLSDSSKHVGVTWDAASEKWRAQASMDGRYVYLGLHATEELAAEARSRWNEAVQRVPEVDGLENQ